MSQYTYIRIALDEQRQGTLTRLVEYGQGAPAAGGDVLQPATVFDFFLNARECFVQWVCRDGLCFGLIFRDAFASDRASYYMLTMHVATGASLTGRQVMRVLTGLRKTMVEERRTTAESITAVLSGCGVPDDPRSLESWHVAPTYTRPEGVPPCYRTYVSAHELESFFTFPLQEEYDRHSYVIYVAATTSLRPGVGIKHVTQPLRDLYTIVLPEGVESSRPAAAGGERIVLTYQRKGYSPIRETVVAGKPSPYVTYDGARMVVRPVSECNLVFTRRIPITVRSSKEGPVTGYTITVNGRPVNTMQPFIEITDQDLADGSHVSVAVSSNNFVTETIDLAPADVDPSKPISVVLRPLEQGVILRLDFGEGRMFEMQISIEKNTPEYSQLHSGSFHGFRARRLTVPGGGEIYYVDVRSGQKPVAPAFDNIAPETRSASTPEADTPAVARRQRRRGRLGAIIGGVLLIGAVCAAGWYWLAGPGSTTTVPAPESDSIAVQAQPSASPVMTPAAEPAAGERPETVVATTPTVADDFSYLNANRVWVRDSLSGQLLALYDALTAANIDAVVRNPYFTQAGAATNADAVRVADLLWGSLGASTQKANEKALRALAGASSIDIHQLYETLARYRSPKPNSEPRPGTAR